MKPKSFFFSSLLSGLLLLSWPGAAGAQESKDLQAFFKKWIEVDVVYIISDEERSVFRKLTSEAERERFIEQFWLDRDPTPGTAANEFREEHYRRLKYANDRYMTGTPGWKTDRGMIYIKFGPPTDIEAYPSGGHYNRPSYEGGGSTSTYPFEIWRYRNLKGIGQDVEIEFVDETLSGQYNIAKSPWAKDALLTVPGAGATDAEMMGLASKNDRIAPRTNPTPNYNPLYFGHGRLKDQPFEKLQLMTKLSRPPELGRPELRQLISAEVKYSQIPFQVRSDYLKIGEQQYLVPITIRIANRNMQYEGIGGVHRSVLDVYGEVAGLSGNVVKSFEETVSSDIPQEQLRTELMKYSLYQKNLELPPGRYKLQLVLKDESSLKVGTTEYLIVVPQLPAGTLTTSSIVPAVRIESIENDSQPLFAMGPVRVFPDLQAETKANGELPIFFQVYNLVADQGSETLQVDVDYVVKAGDREAVRSKDEIRDLKGTSVNVVKYVSTAGLAPGPHVLDITITDLVGKSSITRRLNFTVIP